MYAEINAETGTKVREHKRALAKDGGTSAFLPIQYEDQQLFDDSTHKAERHERVEGVWWVKGWSITPLNEQEIKAYELRQLDREESIKLTSSRVAAALLSDDSSQVDSMRAELQAIKDKRNRANNGERPSRD
jgi:hypothetical protein